MIIKNLYSLLLLVLLLLLVVFINCNPEPNYKIGQYIAINGENEVPDWAQKQSGVMEYQGEKYIWFKGQGLANELAQARTAAKNNSLANAARTIAIIVKKYQQDHSPAINIKAKFKGYITIKSFHRQLARINRLNDDKSPDMSTLGKPQWQYVVMMAYPFQKWLDIVVKQLGFQQESFHPDELDKLKKLTDDEIK